jgi:nucleotide-binding universal stress UspA family protein
MYSKILVPLDGSNLAEGVLPHVQDLAQRYDSEVVLIQVVPPLSKLVTAEAVSMGEAGIDLETASDAAKAERDNAHSYLERVVQRLEAQKIKVQSEVLEGPPGDVIVDYARRHKMDLIAMSTHGRSGLGRLFYGSVADHVLRHAGTPVLLIRSRKGKA